MDRMNDPHPLPYYCNCVGWPRHDVDALSDMIDDARTVNRQTFLRHVNLDDVKRLEKDLGYVRGGLVMSQDFHVSYHKSVLHGQRVYYFRHSAIEYVFYRKEAARAHCVETASA